MEHHHGVKIPAPNKSKTGTTFNPSYGSNFEKISRQAVAGPPMEKNPSFLKQRGRLGHTTAGDAQDIAPGALSKLYAGVGGGEVPKNQPRSLGKKSSKDIPVPDQTTGSQTVGWKKNERYYSFGRKVRW